MYMNNGVISRWALSMRASGRAERTIAERVRIMQASGIDPVGCTIGDLEDWLGGHPEWSQATRRAYIDAMRSCLTWCHARGLRSDNPGEQLPSIRLPKGRPRPITTNDLQVLLASARRHRMRGYLLLAAYAGLRVSEIAAVRGEDIHDGWLTVKGKGGKTARLPLHPALIEYAATMPRVGWWFPAYTRDGHVTGSTVSRVIGDLMRRCGVPGTPHCLRHWYGTQLVAAGVQMRIVQEGMRHTSLQSTQVYTAVTDGQLSAAVVLLPDVA